MKIIGMLRVKNEARWIERVLKSMLPTCEKIFVFDDHSTDNTVAICESFKQVTLIHSPFDETVNETRDKNHLLERVESEGPAWVLHIDGDEEIQAGSHDTLVGLSERGAGPDSYRFQVLYLWDREDQIRVDRLYSRFWRPSFFRLIPGARFHSSAGAGFHCGNVPEIRQVGDCNVKLLHYGYLHREDRIRKFKWYTSDDKQPIPAYEDGYRHMVVGDLFPADSAFMHAGPLQLQQL